MVSLVEPGNGANGTIHMIGRKYRAMNDLQGNTLLADTCWILLSVSLKSRSFVYSPCLKSSVYNAILNDVIFPALVIGCLQNWQPMVGIIGTIDAIGSTNGRDLDGNGMPVVSLVEARTNAQTF